MKKLYITSSYLHHNIMLTKENTHKELKYWSPLLEYYSVKAKACCLVSGHCEGLVAALGHPLGPRGLPMVCQGRPLWPGPVPLPKAKGSGMGLGWESSLCLPPARAQSRPRVSQGHWTPPWGWRQAKAGQEWPCGPAVASLGQGLTALGR